MTPILFDKAALIQGLYSILPGLVVIATGIGFRYPVLGGLLTLFLVSLAGFRPPRASSGSSTCSAPR